MRADVAEALHGERGAVEAEVLVAGPFLEAVNDAEARGLLAAVAAARGHGLAGDDAAHAHLLGVAHGVHVRVHHPHHGLRVGADVGRRDVPFGTDVRAQSVGEAARDAFDLGDGVLARVELDAALAAAEGDVVQRRLEAHPRGQGLHLVEIGLLVVAHAALVRAHDVVVLDAVALEELVLAVVHADRKVRDELVLGLRQDLPDLVGQTDEIGCFFELPGGDRVKVGALGQAGSGAGTLALCLDRLLVAFVRYHEQLLPYAPTKHKITPMTERAMSTMIALWPRVRIDATRARELIARGVREQKGLHSDERRDVSAGLFGMLRHQGRIEHVLGQVRVRLAPGRPRDEARVLTYLVVTKEIEPAMAAESMPGVPWPEVYAADQAASEAPSLKRRLETRYSFTSAVAARLARQFPDEAEAFARASEVRAPFCLRANTLVTTRDKLVDSLREAGVACEPTRYAPHGVNVTAHVRLGAEHVDPSWFEPQDEASQLVAELAGAGEAKLVVDLCAGAGGKTLAMGAAMEGRGQIWALDVRSEPLKELKRRAKRARLPSVRTVVVGQTRWPDEVFALKGQADVVLVDAPCSALGTLRRHPELRLELDEARLAAFAATQRELLARAAELVRPGGRVVYATCTVLREENEDVVASAELEVVDVQAQGLDPALCSGAFMKTWPQHHGMDGFFACILRRP